MKRSDQSVVWSYTMRWMPKCIQEIPYNRPRTKGATRWERGRGKYLFRLDFKKQIQHRPQYWKMDPPSTTERNPKRKPNIIASEVHKLDSDYLCLGPSTITCLAWRCWCGSDLLSSPVCLERSRTSRRKCCRCHCFPLSMHYTPHSIAMQRSNVT